ncbi:MAG: uroporphyrinogen-III C-methyltransferase [Thiobacillaceae bacterium]|jgi:uroporphyrin-3 C-methyltransferase|nr:uroporphyrinogen-III C-methyltransferase [Thiobacillaceae bacterium]
MSETPPRSLWSSPAVGVTALILALAALVAGLGFAWIGYDRMAQLEVQLARRIGEFDAASREARVAAKAANDALADLQSRLMALENRAQETQDQQLALTAMYQDLARSQDERVIADLEQTLLLAQQQLQLAGNVRAALIALEAAETRLAQLGKPQFAALRAAIARDLERLKLLPAADIEGIGARLEALMQNVDQLKSESETEPPAHAVAAPKPGPADTLARLSREIWEEFKSLVRIRRLDHPDLPLLTPSQTYFLRENLKLRLLAARLALLQRDEAGFRADLGAARGWIERYFNRQDAGGKAFAASLDELLRAPVALKDAGIDASLQALRAARKGP